MLGGADNPNGELPSYITGADTESVTLFNDRSAQITLCVFASTARCRFRQIRRRSLPCFLTFHSPSPETFSPVESITRCMLSCPGAFKTDVNRRYPPADTCVIRAAQWDSRQGKNEINKTLFCPQGQPEYTFNNQNSGDGKVRIVLRSPGVGRC